MVRRSARSIVCTIILVGVAIALWFQSGGSGERDLILGRYSIRLFATNCLATYVLLAAAWVIASGGVLRRKIFAVLATTLCGAIVLVCLELPAAIRLIDYRVVFGTPFRKAWENPRNRLDDELIHLHTPYDEFAGTVPGDLVVSYNIQTDRRYEVDVRYDYQGFRNADDIKQADIVLIGDSFVEGPIVDYDDIISAHLSEFLGEQVINLGQIGYGPQQELAVLKRFALPAKPRVVVWVLYEGNDLTHDFIRYRESIKRWDEYIAQSHGFRKRSFSRNLLQLIVRKTSPSDSKKEEDLSKSCVLNIPGEYRGERMFFAFGGSPLSDSDLTNANAALEFIRKGRGICEKEKINFLLVSVPIKYRMYHDLCENGIDSTLAGWKPNDLIDRIGRWAQANEIEFLDLTPALRESAAKGELIFFLDDGHWNGNGHRIGAEEIRTRIEKLGWM